MDNSQRNKFDSSGPVNRFLPPIPDQDVIRSILPELLPVKGWILDPFAALPRLPVELAKAGHRVLVTAGNPVNRFLLDLAAQPPRISDLQAALADLAAARKEGKRLETHLLSIYNTRCEQCKRELSADAFLWDAKTNQLISRIYQCSCGSGGEHPASEEDIENARHWARADGLHRSRVLERVAPAPDADRPFADEALGFYLPRAVYALETIVNRLDSLSASDERRRCMSALLIFAFDCANSLWSHSSDRPRPRQLVFPAVYRENNIWMALENGVKALASNEKAVPLTLWPEEPPESGGICLFEGPLRSLSPNLADLNIQAVFSTIPRPNQAFWTLSALWSGWLWGRSATGVFKSVLRRRRYDWQWHAQALRALFGNLAETLNPLTPFWGLAAEAEAGFVSAIFLAAEASQFNLDSHSIQNETDIAVFHWKMPSQRNKLSRKGLPLDIHYTIRLMCEILEKRQEPMLYMELHAATLAGLAKKGMLSWTDDMLGKLAKNLHSALDSPEFIDLENRAAPETGLWALKKWDRQQKLDGL